MNSVNHSWNRRWSRALRRLLPGIGLALSAVTAGAQETTKLLRQPDVSKTDIVFVYGGNLWLTPRAGGTARLLTANPSLKRFPKFSPDGKYIAFTGNYDGNNDVYIIPAGGGEPKRLTYHPADDQVLGWTPDSKAVLFRSRRTSFSQRFDKLFTAPITGGMEKELPLPEAGLAWFSPDGKQLAYNRISREFATWKRYRGGLQSYISLYDLAKNSYSELPHTDTTDYYPMWHGDMIYFASDRTNTVNLYAFNLKTKQVKALTHYTDYDVKWPSLGPDSLVYEQGGVLHLFDLATEKERPLSIQANSELLAARPGLRRVEGQIHSGSISPSGARAVFEARGELFTAPAKKGDSRNLSNSPGAREIRPTWSPDGKTIAYFSDKTGEYEVYTRAQDGRGDETQVTRDSKIYLTELGWSPDSKSLLYMDATLKMWLVTLADKKRALVDSSTIGALSLGRWSPDSKWIVYTKPDAAQQSNIWLYSVAQGKSYQVSSGKFSDREPVFDNNGKYLYFVSDRHFAPSIVGPELNINFQNTAGLFLLTLQADTPSPLSPESDEEKVKEEDKAAKKEEPKKEEGKPAGDTPPAVKIDLEGLGQRLAALPVPPGEYHGLNPGKDKLFYLAGPVLTQFDFESRQGKPILSGVQGYDVNPAGTKILYRAGSTQGIIDATPGQAEGAGKLTLALEAHVDPRAEWKQIYWEAWRLERDFYYDPNMHGLDWKAIGDRYGSLLPSVSNRDDLTYLLSELLGELNTSHAYVQGAEAPEVRRVNGGLLGVDFEAVGDYYRIKKIYPGENWLPNARSPLTEAGVKVKAGDYLLAVNGVPLKTTMNPYALFEGTADKTTTLRVNDKPSDQGAHDTQVKPVASETTLRYLDWTEANRKKVAEATGGRVGYVHVPDTAEGGMTEFGKGFYSQLDKEALIVDERFNSGGYVPDFFVEKLGRKIVSRITPRYGLDQNSPGGAIYGPKVMLANEWAGSGGDAFPYYFRKEGVGPIIGKRTWGGLVGINDTRLLMDGGGVTVPEFGIWSPIDNQWIAENHGVEPDIEVANTPDRMQNGGDPQLERAIAYILDQLKNNPPPKYKHPPFPVEKGK